MFEESFGQQAVPGGSTPASQQDHHHQLQHTEPTPPLDAESTSKSQKKRRFSEAHSEIIKHSSLYFPNGDIVLLSLPNTKNNIVTAFKVDRIFLLRASPVFEGMLALPMRVHSEDELFDSVPLVRLQDESEHLEKFLGALYDSRCIPWRKHDPSTLRIGEGILLLANKYQVDHLRESIINLLERDWPSTLSEWDLNEGELGVIKENREGTSSMDSLTPEPCSAIRLARKCGVQSILPAAFYHLSRIRGTADRRLSESTVGQQDREKDASCVLEGERTADFSLLGVEDFRCLIVGRDAVFDVFKGYIETATERATQGHYEYCISSDPSECVRGLYKFGDQLEVEMLRNRDPLFLMKDGGTCFAWPSQTCEPCRGRFLSTLEASRDDFWRRLPSLFLLNNATS